MRLFTSSEAREIDRRAIETMGIPGLLLMENAALGAVDVILKELGEPYGKKVLIVSGKGNNGGDGLAVARHLTNRGVQVHILLLCHREEVKGDAEVNLKIALNMGLPIHEFSGDVEEDLSLDLLSFDLIVDAIFGTGFRGPARGHIACVILDLNHVERPLISLDVPSGLNPDTGQVEGPCIRAKRTVTFGTGKLGLFLYPGMEYAGEVSLIDIGLPPGLLEPPDSSVYLTDREHVAHALPLRKGDAHKGDFGHLLVVAGSTGMVGAGLLTSLAGLRSGAGLVTLGIPAGLLPVVSGRIMEVMTIGLPENQRGTLSHGALDDLIRISQGMKTVALGPGLSQDPDIKILVRDLVLGIDVPLIIDADGLNALAGSADILSQRRCATVITPHPGEMARLCQTSISKVQEDRIGNALRAAGEWNTVVILKGARTVIAAPDGRIYVNPTGNPGMATAGSGDVLTGIVGGLLCQMGDPLEAAIAGTYIHGLAGDICAGKIGEEPLMAGDILQALPLALRRVRTAKHFGEGDV